jgi:hypothetical protein
MKLRSNCMLDLNPSQSRFLSLVAVCALTNLDRLNIWKTDLAGTLILYKVVSFYRMVALFRQLVNITTARCVLSYHFQRLSINAYRKLMLLF